MSSQLQSCSTTSSMDSLNNQLLGSHPHYPHQMLMSVQPKKKGIRSSLVGRLFSSSKRDKMLKERDVGSPIYTNYASDSSDYGTIGEISVLITVLIFYKI